MRALAILLASTVATCAQEGHTPIWPGTPEFKPLWSSAEKQRKPQVRGWVRHAPPARTIIKRDVVSRPEKIKQRCKPSVAATGDSAKSETAAKLESQKAWKGEVQWQYGNMYLDLQNAEDISYQCGPSSVPRYGGTVEATVSKFLPIESITCRVKASPCAVPVQKDNGK